MSNPPNPTVSCQCAPSISSGSPTESKMCIQVTNLSGETLNFSAADATSPITMWFKVPPMTSGDTPYTVQFSSQSFWTIRGSTSGVYYLQNQLYTTPQWFQIIKSADFTNYTDTAVDGLRLGHATNTRNRKKYCELHPEACTLNVIHTPKTCKVELKGYPPGFKKNAWWFPCVIASLITVVLFLGLPGIDR